METEVAAEVVNQLSMWDMVWSSDLITKAVMIGLIAASVWSWAIIFEKINTLRQVKRLSKTFEERFWSGGSLDKLYDSIGNPQDPMSAMFVAAMNRGPVEQLGTDVFPAHGCGDGNTEFGDTIRLHIIRGR